MLNCYERFLKCLIKFSFHHVPHNTDLGSPRNLYSVPDRGKSFILGGKHKQDCYRTTKQDADTPSIFCYS
jgi:hypothetical protein